VPAHLGSPGIIQRAVNSCSSVVIVLLNS